MTEALIIHCTCLFTSALSRSFFVSFIHWLNISHWFLSRFDFLIYIVTLSFSASLLFSDFNRPAVFRALFLSSHSFALSSLSSTSLYRPFHSLHLSLRLYINPRRYFRNSFSDWSKEHTTDQTLALQYCLLHQDGWYSRSHTAYSCRFWQLQGMFNAVSCSTHTYSVLPN